MGEEDIVELNLEKSVCGKEKETDNKVGVDEDDCEVIVEDMGAYKETEPDLADNIELELVDNTFVDVELCENLEDQFGDAACEDENSKSDDSGDDIWDEYKVP